MNMYTNIIITWPMCRTLSSSVTNVCETCSECFAEYHSSSATLGSKCIGVKSQVYHPSYFHSVGSHPQHKHVLYMYISITVCSLTGRCHTVLVLSSEDGRQRLVRAAADISQSVLKRQLRIEDLDPHLIGTRLTGSGPLWCWWHCIE